MTLRTDTFLDAIRAGHTRFAAKFARRDTLDGTAPAWEDFGPPRAVEFHVSIRREPLKGRLAAQHPVGEILCVTPIERVATLIPSESYTWAEYGEASYNGDGHFEVEGWHMQLVAVL